MHVLSHKELENKMTTDKKWLLHLEASRSALIRVIGFNSHWHYKNDVCRFANYSKRAAECLRNFVPYSIQKIDENSSKVIILNREYKPIGYCGLNADPYRGGDWVNYSDFDSAIADMESPEMKAFLNACGKDRGGREWLWFTFNDLTAPWNGAKNVKRLIGLIDAALEATVNTTERNEVGA
jgi:hypothetical protein